MRAKTAPSLQLVQDATMDRLVVSAVSKVGGLGPPWAPPGVLRAAAALSHLLWGRAPAVAWAAVGCRLGTTVLTGLTWVVAHARRLVGRLHATLTTAAACGWFTAATIAGMDVPAVYGSLFFGGLTLAISWNIRTGIRMAAGDDVSSGGRAPA